MGKDENEFKFHLNEKYALSDNEIKDAMKAARKMGSRPDFDKVRAVEELPIGEITITLKGRYPGTNFTKN